MSSKFIAMFKKLLKIRFNNSHRFDDLEHRLLEAQQRSEKAKDEFEQALKRVASDNDDAAHGQG